MNTDIKQKYYEFKVPDNEYYALIAAGSKEYAIAKYYEDIIDDCDYEVSCQEIPSPMAWKKFSNNSILDENFISDENTMRELVNQFDQSGLLLISAEIG